MCEAYPEPLRHISRKACALPSSGGHRRLGQEQRALVPGAHPDLAGYSFFSPREVKAVNYSSSAVCSVWWFGRCSHPR